MPDRLYVSATPIRRRDRILEHPGSAVLGVWSFLLGLVLIVDMALPGFRVSPLLNLVPDPALVWLAGVMLAGGALVLVALLRNWGRVDTSWRFERGGWWLLFGGWSLISALVFITSPQSVLAWGSYAAFAVSGFIRGQAVRLTEERTRIVKDQE